MLSDPQETLSSARIGVDDPRGPFDVFGAELETMIESGAGLVLGTVDADGTPRGVRAWSATVVSSVPTRPSACVFTGPTTRSRSAASGRGRPDRGRRAHVAFGADEGPRRQRRAAHAPPTSRLTRDQTERFFAALLVTDGNPIEMLQRMLPVEHDGGRDRGRRTVRPDAGAGCWSVARDPGMSADSGAPALDRLGTGPTSSAASEARSRRS